MLLWDVNKIRFALEIVTGACQMLHLGKILHKIWNSVHFHWHASQNPLFKILEYSPLKHKVKAMLIIYPSLRYTWMAVVVQFVSQACGYKHVLSQG